VRAPAQLVRARQRFAHAHQGAASLVESIARRNPAARDSGSGEEHAQRLAGHSAVTSAMARTLPSDFDIFSAPK
jgi:hypothetical protein